MNPYTRSLLDQLDDPALEALVACWDDLEALVIEVFRTGKASPEDETRLAEIKQRWQIHYGAWREALTPYWQQVKIDGQVVTDDPFVSLMGVAKAADYVNNWGAMKTLPAAREALNLYLQSQINKSLPG